MADALLGGDIAQQLAAWDAWFSENDTVVLDRSWTFEGLGRLNVTRLENLRGFLLQGAALEDRISALPIEAAEPNEEGAQATIEDDVLVFPAAFVAEAPFARQRPLRFGAGTGLEISALSGALGTGAVAGGIILALVALLSAIKISVVLGLFLGTIAAVVIALALVGKRGIRLESVAMEGNLGLDLPATVSLELGTGMATVDFGAPKLRGAVPAISATGTIGGVRVSDASVVFADARAIDAILSVLPMPRLTFNAGTQFLPAQGGEGGRTLLGAEGHGRAVEAVRQQIVAGLYGKRG